MATMSTTDTAPPPIRSQYVLIGVVAALMLALTLHIDARLSWQPAQTFLMGCLLGFVLFRAAFGFTGPWRAFVVQRKGTGLRKTFVMLGAAAVTMMLLGAYGDYPQVVHPVGWSLLFGAFIFGIGMQLSGCCGSGTAWVAGGGSARIMVTFSAFIAGSVWGSIDAPAWWSVPKFARLSMVESFGVWGAIAATFALLAALFALSIVVERARHGALPAPAQATGPLWQRALYGPWSATIGGLVMGILTGLVLVFTLQPWGITFGYTIYGAKIATALGVDLASYTAPFTDRAFWAQSWAQNVLEQPIWRNNAANMNIGILLGAALASGLVDKWHPSLRGIPLLSLLAAVLGGLLMGYGARISTGCNIGAMVNGIASGSLHGWAWMAAAFVGSLLGIALRPAFRLSNS